jgi:hypothetical protein
LGEPAEELDVLFVVSAAARERLGAEAEVAVSCGTAMGQMVGGSVKSSTRTTEGASRYWSTTAARSSRMLAGR